MADVIHDRTDRSRFELEVDGSIAFIDYVRRGSVLVLTHAEVPPALGGQGVGTRLVAATLTELARRGESIVPRCPFIARYIERNPRYASLVSMDGGVAGPP